MELLKRKIDQFLSDWKKNPNRLPLVIKGARQIGKTASVSAFARKNYESVIEINFVFQKKYNDIFKEGYEVDSIVKNISFINPSLKFIPGKTLFFFDEMQSCPACATSLKSFKIDGRYDVICSGSLMGINYREIESNSVGYKEDYDMCSMDFEEFLWAKGYSTKQIEDLLSHMRNVEPLSKVEMDVMSDIFKDYMIIGGMPAVVNSYIKSGNYSGTLKMQKQLLIDYEEDITKYAEGMDKGKIKDIYNHISVFLGQENKKFRITKVANNARSKNYIGTTEWLNDAGIINICYCLAQMKLPLKGNYNPKIFKIYYRDTGLLIASLDDESQEDLRNNKNFGTYKGAIYENIAADMLAKQGYGLYYYRNEKSTIEMDFFIRDASSLIPIEVKASDNSAKSLNAILSGKKEERDIKYGIKLCNRNIGFNGSFYTFPYFLGFLLKRFVSEHKEEA